MAPIWVSHLRKGDARLKTLLQEGEVLCHPFVVGELACGRIRNRKEILSLLHALPMGQTATHEEILHFIESNRLVGAGLGLIDVQLLAAALLSKSPLWTSDRKLKAAATRLNVRYEIGK